MLVGKATQQLHHLSERLETGEKRCQEVILFVKKLGLTTLTRQRKTPLINHDPLTIPC